MVRRWKDKANSCKGRQKGEENDEKTNNAHIPIDYHAGSPVEPDGQRTEQGNIPYYTEYIHSVKRKQDEKETTATEKKSTDDANARQIPRKARHAINVALRPPGPVRNCRPSLWGGVSQPQHHRVITKDWQPNPQVVQHGLDAPVRLGKRHRRLAIRDTELFFATIYEGDSHPVPKPQTRVINSECWT